MEQPQPTGGPEQPQQSGGQPMASTDRDQRTWAMLCHLSAFAGYVFPLGNIFGPLIVWLVKREQHPLVEDQGKESLNFQLSVTLYAIVGVVLSFVIIGIPLLIALVIFDLIVVILAAVKANDGVAYRYPLNIRFIS